MTYHKYDRSYLFETGDGAGTNSEIEDRIDKEAIIENDGRGLNSTFFYADDADYDNPDMQRRMKRLAKMNDGMWESSRGARNFMADMNRAKESICDGVQLTKFQTECVMWTMDRLPVAYFGRYSTEKVTLAVITLICEKDMRMISDEQAFREVMETLEVSPKDLRQMRKMARKYPWAFDATIPIPDKFK